ncbi:triose-phosphate isomerase [Candidatus Woesearchaeota archaeon]|mgnify:CR=1 FL=1|nr:triose-phosphate isomerase [Candidatus Woesearchaeota archaeon]|tara:strand:+ start:456 stop:1199 length:744 start_codon:yes stop_codon:yes gene_type:complete
MTRKTLIAANWKMNKTIKETVSFINDFKNLIKKIKNVEIVICPPFTSLNESSKLLKSSNIRLGAQNIHYENKGAFTGEISPVMIKELAEYVVLGHSERRQYFNETNQLINKKIKAALKNKLKVILCIGETLQQRESNKTTDIIENQIKNCLKDINEMKNIAIAYEPIWAIGTGKTASPEQAEETHKFIRQLLKKLYNENISNNARIIYGGSVNEKNAKALLKMKNIDGALVGGASLEPETFSKICNV